MTSEYQIAAYADNIRFLTSDETRDVVPIMEDIRKAAEAILQLVEEGAA